MERVSLLQFRRHAEAIIRKVRQGRRLLLTYRGKPVMRLEPIPEQAVADDDPFYGLHQVSDAGGAPLSNEEIDQIVYKE
jgi:antitoxin (DNA-binding transcriptional repressor) of toxin-antitoxin stability system